MQQPRGQDMYAALLWRTELKVCRILFILESGTVPVPWDPDRFCSADFPAIFRPAENQEGEMSVHVSLSIQHPNSVCTLGTSILGSVITSVFHNSVSVCMSSGFNQPLHGAHDLLA